MVRVKVRKRPVRLRVDSTAALRVAGNDLRAELERRIEGGVKRVTGQLSRSPTVLERTTARGLTKIKVGPTGRRYGPGGARMNAGVAKILEATGKRLGVPERREGEILRGAVFRFRVRLETAGGFER